MAPTKRKKTTMQICILTGGNNLIKWIDVKGYECNGLLPPFEWVIHRKRIYYDATDEVKISKKLWTVSERMTGCNLINSASGTMTETLAAAQNIIHKLGPEKIAELIGKQFLGMNK